MDWDMKMGSWDLAELERDNEPNIGSVVGSGVEVQTSDLDCSVDLKLGDFVSSSKWNDQLRTSSSSSSSKRPRAPGNGSQNASCLVDGCSSDLSNCREYHRRHKVCEAHSKTPIVLVGGQEQRFCQQCSRFHLLVEFDEVKRSCRKRLDGHNRRRRKPQLEPINSGTLPPSLQAHRFSSYPHIFTGATSDPSWSNAVKHEDETLYGLHSPLQFIDRQQSNYPGTFSRNYREGKRFPFLHDNDAAISSQAALETRTCQPLLRTISFTENRSDGRKMFSDGFTHVLDSDCALSLLSSPTETPGVNNLSHMVPAGRFPIAQPLPQSLQQYGGGLGRFSRSQSSNNVSTTGFSCSGMDEEHAGTVLVSDSSNAELQCPSGLFHVGGDGSSGGPTTILPFSWQ